MNNNYSEINKINEMISKKEKHYRRIINKINKQEEEELYFNNSYQNLNRQNIIVH